MAKTATECAAMWEALRLEIIERIDAIDKATPGESEDPPEWWMQMNSLRRSAIDATAVEGLKVTP